ncbi:PREDICTED: AAA-ATPase [Prunus dulcis]|uniref:PREDICTED: AAA-ATPase n=1 Tax=Prunus dulcis TaxID=3755 RepID=A0A5E4FJF3_PRUDU|nr:AAA-ATPase At5g57480 [Prunus dulcis]VVA28065.1 PREDICTED: AAA-ATPase [Prunus dulcis]
MKEYWTSLASLLGVLAFCQSLLQTVFPPELRFAFVKLFNKIFHWFSSYYYFDITEIDGVNTNELYNAVQLYLSSTVSISGSRLSLTRALNSSAITFGLSNNDCMVDAFDGVTVLWEHVVTQRQSQTFSWRPLPEEKRGFTLRIKKKDKYLILNSYLDFIMDKANEIRRKNQDRLLYTNSRGGSLDSRGHPWESVPFKHPSTFDTLAMDPKVKKEIMNDLKDFANGQAFYQKTGRAWKRGYLLYGPPGTGKSSMIAAMANFLGYDIYDLELTEVHTNSELRKLLMKTSSKSIIVIEDIDCSINLTNRKKNNGGGGGASARTYYDSMEMRGGGGGVSVPGEEGGGGNSITLSGLLNFTDGLWSCCGSERIFVFTTNHIEKLDPALLRSGRMDMHIFMSHCSYPALKILLKNYLGYEEGDLDEEIGKEFEGVLEKAGMTPADVSEVLIKNRRDKGNAVRELLEALKARAEKNNAVGGSREKVNGGHDLEEEEEEEEQEKRALESPKEEGCDFVEDSCKKGDEKDPKEDNEIIEK